MLGPRNGICTRSSTASAPLATNTAAGATGARRHASHAAAPEGTATRGAEREDLRRVLSKMITSSTSNGQSTGPDQ
jgi:hypothetical protein